MGGTYIVRGHACHVPVVSGGVLHTQGVRTPPATVAVVAASPRRRIVGNCVIPVHVYGRVTGSYRTRPVPAGVLVYVYGVVRCASVAVSTVFTPPHLGVALQARTAVTVFVGGTPVVVAADGPVPTDAVIPDAAWPSLRVWDSGVQRPAVGRPRIHASVTASMLRVAWDIPTLPVIGFSPAHVPVDAYAAMEYTRIEIPMRVTADGLVRTHIRDPRGWAADLLLTYEISRGRVVSWSFA